MHSKGLTWMRALSSFSYAVGTGCGSNEHMCGGRTCLFNVIVSFGENILFPLFTSIQIKTI